MTRRTAVYDALGVFVFALAVRLWLIALHPEIFGGDAVLRLANRDRIQLAYQLPALQAAIYAVSKFFHDPVAVRYMMAVIGSMASVGCQLLASSFMPRTAALATALMFASNPFLIQLSIVPYQEVLMLGALLFAFHFFFAGRIAASSVALALACLTRYEAWAACPVLAAVYVRERGLRVPVIVKAALLFGIVPCVWILYNTGISTSGTFVIELPASIYRLMRYVYLGWITAKNTPIPVLALAAIGVWTLWKHGILADRRVQVLCGFLGLVTIAILFSAHGESPDPERFVTAREASLWIAAVIFAAGIALARHSRAWTALAAAGIVLGVIDAERVVRRDVSEPRTRLAYAVAHFLDDHVDSTDTAVIFTKPVPPQLVDQYLQKATLRGGETGRRKALDVLASMETTPPDYQRTLIHSRLGKQRVRSLAGNVAANRMPVTVPPCVGWAVVWSDFAPSNDTEASFHSSTFARVEPVHRLTFGSMSAAIYQGRFTECR